MGDAIVGATAAIAGVLLGIVSQAVLAARQRRWTVADEAARWRRDKRLEAYAAFDAAVARMRITAAWWTAGDTGREGSVADSIRELTAAHALVDMVGPDSVADQAGATQRAALDLVGGEPGVAAHADVEEAFDESVEAWRSAVRRALAGD